MNLRFWMRDSVKKNKKFMAILFAVSMLFSLCIVGILSNQRYLAERQHVDTLAEAYISRGNLLIDDMLQNAQLLKLLLLRQNGDTRNFNEFARNILSRQEVIEGILLAPAGRVDARFSNGEVPEGMQDGTSLFAADQAWAAAADWSRSKGTVSFMHRTDGHVLVFYPVYIGAAQNRSFWGMIVLQVSESRFFAQVNAAGPAPIAYELYSTNPWDMTEYQIAASPESVGSHPVERQDKTGYLAMRLKAAPVTHWLDYAHILINLLLAILFSLFVTVLGGVFYKLRQQKSAFEQLASRDTLTGIYNRRKFVEVLQKACEDKQPFLLCYIDFDRFKEVNDTYGHDVGDLLLQAGAKRLLGCIRSTDMLFRIGGDEFVAFIKDPGTPESREARTRLLGERMQAPFHFGEVKLYMDISVGYVLYPQDAQTSEELVRMADHRMYVEKQRHKE